MRIALISDESSVKLLEAVQERLLREIVDLETEFYYVQLVTDIPFKCSELTEAFDILFVFSSYEKENMEIQVVLNKLIDLEMKAGTKIIKGLQLLEELPELEDLEEEKDSLADKWSRIILSNLIEEKNEGD